MGSTWGWGILWKGPFKSGPVSCVCCTLDCQVSGGRWTGQTSSDSGSTRLILKDSRLCYVCSSLLFPFSFSSLLLLQHLFLYLSSSPYFPFHSFLFSFLPHPLIIPFPSLSSPSSSHSPLPPGLLCHWHSQATIYLC